MANRLLSSSLSLSLCLFFFFFYFPSCLFEIFAISNMKPALARFSLL